MFILHVGIELSGGRGVDFLGCQRDAYPVPWDGDDGGSSQLMAIHQFKFNETSLFRILEIAETGDIR